MDRFRSLLLVALLALISACTTPPTTPAPTTTPTAEPDRLAFADGGVDTDAHTSADIDGQPKPDGNSQPCGKHLTATVRDTHRLTRRRR